VPPLFASSEKPHSADTPILKRHSAFGFAAGRILRYVPSGKGSRILLMPVDQPTTGAFGGTNLALSFVTSAQQGLSEIA